MRPEIEAVALTDELFSKIYDGVQDEACWINALEMIRVTLGCVATVLKVTQTTGRPQHHFFAAGPKAGVEATAVWTAVSPYELAPIAGLRIGEARMVNWRDFNKSSAILKLFEEAGTEKTATVCFDIVNGAEWTLNCNRGASDQPFRDDEIAFLKTIATHFQRATAMRRNIIHRSSLTTLCADSLDKIGIAAFLIKESMEYVALNSAAQSCIAERDFLHDRAGSIHLGNKHEDALFQKSVKKALFAGSDGFSWAFKASDSSGRSPPRNIIVSSRLMGGVLDMLAMHALVFVRCPDAISDEDSELLRMLYAFTKAEAALAVRLAQGLRTHIIEAQLGITHNTARAHLRSIYAKTGINSQAELITLVNDSLLPLGRKCERRM